MKKIFAIAFIAATMVACNNGGESKTPAVDSAAIKAAADSVAAAQAAAAVAADTTVKAATDTIIK